MNSRPASWTIALIAGADGVHLGAQDLPREAARRPEQLGDYLSTLIVGRIPLVLMAILLLSLALWQAGLSVLILPGALLLALGTSGRRLEPLSSLPRPRQARRGWLGHFWWSLDFWQ